MGESSVQTPQVAAAILGAWAYVRYVALKLGDDLWLQQRSDLSDASSSVSDRYEELLVNPTLLALTAARGKIDCGGLEFVLVRYGNFFQLVYPVRDGHISVAISSTADPLALVKPIRELLYINGLLPIV
jgi:hypothetical protein